MKKRLLGKNVKISFVNEDEVKGLSVAKKAHTESGKINKSGLEDGYTKLTDLYKFDDSDDDALKTPPKYTRKEDLDGYEIEAKGAGKMQGLRYDNEGTEVYDKFDERIDKLNDTSEYDKVFGTHDGFGEGKKDNVYDDLKKKGEEYKKYKYGDKYKEVEDEYQETPRVRTTVKEGKMKRLNFKQSFKDDNHMLSLIPENYKNDNHTFLMTDGNETYKVRWEGNSTLGEGVILQYQNKERINEDTEKMKKLFGYKQSSVVGKTNDYINETVEFKKMFDIIREQTNDLDRKKEELRDRLDVLGTTKIGSNVDQHLKRELESIKSALIPANKEEELDEIEKRIDSIENKK